NGEVARAVGLNPFRISRLKRDPLFAAEVAAAERDLRARVTEAVADALLSDAPRNISFLTPLRDRRLAEPAGPTASSAVRVGGVTGSAALDRQPRRRRASLAEIRAEQRVVLTVEQAELIRQVMEETADEALELANDEFSSVPAPARHLDRPTREPIG